VPAETVNLQSLHRIDFEIAFQVGDWSVDPGLNKIWRQDSDPLIDRPATERTVTPKVMATCVLLAKLSPSTVSQQQIADNIWPGQAISDSSIYQVIAQLRKAFDDNDSPKRFIERISGKGYRLIAPLSQQTSVATQNSTAQPKRKQRLIAGGLAAILAVIVIFLSNQYEPAIESSASLFNQLQSVAITRAKNHTEPKIHQLDIFNDLLMSELIKIKSLRIVHLRDDSQPPATDAVLSSTIQKQGEQLQISVQLIATNSQQVLWAELFYGEISELFSIQQKINQKLAELFQPGAKVEEHKIAVEVSDDTYLQYVLALHLWDKRTPDSLLKAKQIYIRILQKEPRYIKALVGLCNSYLALHVYSNWSNQKAIAECQPLLDKAYRYSPDNGEVLATKALLLAHNKDNHRAKKAFELAIKHAPNYAFAYQWYGTFLRNTGEYTKALNIHLQAFALAPLSPSIIRSLAYSHLNLRQMDKAKRLYQRALTIEPVYSHRALEELDFLPLNVERANHFLDWVKNETQNPTMQPVYQLTHVLVLLSVNRIEKAEKVLINLDQERLNPAFHLYVQAALAAAKGDTDLAVKKLRQRLDIAPEITRYAMPYIAALYASKQNRKALQAFQKYFPEINQATAINIENYHMFIFLIDLLAANNKQQAIIADRLSAFFDSNSIAESELSKIFWQIQSGQKLAAKKAVEKLLNDGWLPDYNDNIFAEKELQEIYIAAGGLASDWATLIIDNQTL